MALQGFLHDFEAAHPVTGMPGAEVFQQHLTPFPVTSFPPVL